MLASANTNNCYVGFAVSGASTVAAADTQAIIASSLTTVQQLSATFMVTV